MAACRIDCIVRRALQSVRPHATVPAVTVLHRAVSVGRHVLRLAVEDVALAAVAHAPASHDWERREEVGGTERVRLAGGVAHLPADRVGELVVVPVVPRKMLAVRHATIRETHLEAVDVSCMLFTSSSDRRPCPTRRRPDCRGG